MMRDIPRVSPHSDKNQEARARQGASGDNQSALETAVMFALYGDIF
jgi:hypothetical protein